MRRELQGNLLLLCMLLARGSELQLPPLPQFNTTPPLFHIPISNAERQEVKAILIASFSSFLPLSPSPTPAPSSSVCFSLSLCYLFPSLSSSLFSTLLSVVVLPLTCRSFWRLGREPEEAKEEADEIGFRFYHETRRQKAEE